MMTTTGSAGCSDQNQVIDKAPDLSNGPPGDHSNQQSQSSNIQESIESTPILVEYRPIGDVCNICQVNVEGLSEDKSEFLSRFLYENGIEIFLMQETHKADEAKLLQIGKIRNFRLIDGINHPKYGIATFARSDVTDISVIDKLDHDNVAVIVIKVKQLTIVNVYKPPTIAWPFALPVFEHPVAYMGDFNSYHELWNYRDNDSNGAFIVDWAINNGRH